MKKMKYLKDEDFEAYQYLMVAFKLVGFVIVIFILFTGLGLFLHNKGFFGTWIFYLTTFLGCGFSLFGMVHFLMKELKK